MTSCITINHNKAGYRERPCMPEDSWCCSWATKRAKILKAFLMGMVYLFLSLSTLLADPCSYCYCGWMTQRFTQITEGIRTAGVCHWRAQRRTGRHCHDINVYISPAVFWLYHMYTSSIPNNVKMLATLPQHKEAGSQDYRISGNFQMILIFEFPKIRNFKK